MYMSYCRFEGTRMELDACLAEVAEHIEGCAEDEVSDREIEEFRKIVKNMYWMMAELEIIDENGELNESELDWVCEKMAEKMEEDDYE